MNVWRSVHLFVQGIFAELFMFGFILHDLQYAQPVADSLDHLFDTKPGDPFVLFFISRR